MVGRSVGLSVMIMIPAKTAEPTEMLFRMWTRVDPRNHVLDEVQISHARGNFKEEIKPSVKYRNTMP